MITLHYRSGRIQLEGGELMLDSLESSDEYPAYKYREIKERLEASSTDYTDKALDKLTPSKLETDIKLRDYQEQALTEWSRYTRGIVVLPTGAGKTILAVKAMESLQASTLVVVPTIVLVDQWREVLENAFNVEVGALGGGHQEIRPLTVATYDSASLRARILGNRFEFIVFDEVHHLAAPTYRRIASRYLSPHRLGLTATLQKDEATIELFSELVGDVVFEMGVDSLAGTHLAEFTVKTVRLPLTAHEKNEYDRQYGIYRSFLQRRGIRIRSSRDYLSFVKRSGRDPEARRALLSRNRAVNIALNSSTKIAYLKSLLQANPVDKTLIFTSHNKLVYSLSKELLIPAITHQTPREERGRILSGFMDGSYRRIVTSRVLDEGVDVPDASIAVIISGSGSNRQFIQRLGRILRKRPGKQAVLFELVSAGTVETRISDRRKKS
ncbi:MAG: DEAD/DEAH box helicase [Candidatus Bathyarchaeota archaeon]|nr:DEAD/DEAH box helicase [Candidatus Bathyarchaeota archaeon]